jgi:hypothetical protein
MMQEVTRIKGQHLNDRNAIVNGRVKGKINVTRAFGVGYLKQVIWASSISFGVASNCDDSSSTSVKTRWNASLHCKPDECVDVRFFFFHSLSLEAQVEQQASGSLQDRLRRHGPVRELRAVAVPPPRRVAGQVPGAVLRRAVPVLHQQGGGGPGGGGAHRRGARRRPRAAPRRGARAPRREEGR